MPVPPKAYMPATYRFVRDDKLRILECKLILARNIRRRREELGWTTLQASKALGCPESTWVAYETIRQTPQFKRLIELCQTLGITLNELTKGFDGPYDGRSRKTVSYRNQRRSKEGGIDDGRSVGIDGLGSWPLSTGVQGAVESAYAAAIE